jgi:Na+/H+ antiporter NhaC
MKTVYLISTLFLGCFIAKGNDSLAVKVDTVDLDKISFFVENDRVSFQDLSIQNGILKYEVDGEEMLAEINGSKATVDKEISFKGELLYIKSNEGKSLYHIAKLKQGGYRVKNIPLWTSILPPLIAIALALLFKEVLVSLFVGIWSGIFLAGGMRMDSFYYFFSSMLAVVREYVIKALNDTGHLSVIVFSLLIGGMVAIISKNGGMVGVVNILTRYAKTPRSTLFVTWLLGVVIFFDDYANTLIVGNTMRSVTDKYKISREKLAYIVDATAAPVAAIAFITTWIGAELGYIDDGLRKIGLDADYTPYSVFISSLQYSYYTIYTLIFMLFIIYLRKDFGSMYKAEIRARTTGQVSPAKTKDEDEPNMEDLSPVAKAKFKWWLAAIPVFTVIFMTIMGLLDSGFDSLYSSFEAGAVEYSWSSIWSNMQLISSDPSVGFFRKLGMIIGASDSYGALLWASLSGVMVAILLTVSSKIMSLFDTMHWMVNGFKTMMPAVVILCLAWSLAKTTDVLHTADFMSNALTGNVSPQVLPSIIFILAALISFSTGSSWSTMAILYPIAIPTAYNISVAAGLSPDQTMEILYSVIATVLSASVLGDHCSPISDTTILSSLASDCNHIDHVKTQMPYALTVGAVAFGAKGIGSLLGGGYLVNGVIFVISIFIMYAIVKYIGKEVPDSTLVDAN